MMLHCKAKSSIKPLNMFLPLRNRTMPLKIACIGEEEPWATNPEARIPAWAFPWYRATSCSFSVSFDK